MVIPTGKAASVLVAGESWDRAQTEKKARPDSSSDGRPAWMRTLHTTASNWLHLIPQTLSHLKRTVENIKVAAPRLVSGGLGRSSRVGLGRSR